MLARQLLLMKLALNCMLGKSKWCATQDSKYVRGFILELMKKEIQIGLRVASTREAFKDGYMMQFAHLAH